MNRGYLFLDFPVQQNHFNGLFPIMTSEEKMHACDGNLFIFTKLLGTSPTETLLPCSFQFTKPRLLEMNARITTLRHQPRTTCGQSAHKSRCSTASWSRSASGHATEMIAVLLVSQCTISSRKASPGNSGHSCHTSIGYSTSRLEQTYVMGPAEEPDIRFSTSEVHGSRVPPAVQTDLGWPGPGVYWNALLLFLKSALNLVVCFPDRCLLWRIERYRAVLGPTRFLDETPLTNPRNFQGCRRLHPTRLCRNRHCSLGLLHGSCHGSHLKAQIGY